MSSYKRAAKVLRRRASTASLRTIIGASDGSNARALQRLWNRDTVSMNAISTELPIAKVNIVFESRQRRRLLLVECKSALEYALDHAAGFRGNMLRNWDLDAPYFMFAFTGGLYLWRRETLPDALPDFTASPESIWKAYVGERGRGPQGICAHGVEIAIRIWLEDLAWGIRELDPQSEADQLIVRSGLYERMRDGSARFENLDP